MESKLNRHPGGVMEAERAEDSGRYDAESRRLLRAWRLDPEDLARQAEEKYADDPSSAPSANEILERWGMDPLPEQDQEALVRADHERHFREVFSQEYDHLSALGMPRRKARKQAFKVALVERDGGYPPTNEFGFTTEADEERYIPGSLRDRMQQALGAMSARVANSRLSRKMHDMHTALVERLSPRQRKIATGLGVVAAVAAFGTGITAAATEYVAPATAQILDLPRQFIESDTAPRSYQAE